MAGRVFQITHPRAEWLKRVATGLLDQSPQMKPLEAVRRAMDVFPDSLQDDPEAVASSLLVKGPGDGRADQPGEHAAGEERKRRRA